MTQLAMTLPINAIRGFCAKWRIRELAVFGSILRDDFGPASDVDFLYVLEPGVRWGFEIVRMQEELAGMSAAGSISSRARPWNRAAIACDARTS